VIARADTLTEGERATIKQAVWRDLLAAGLGDSLAVLERLAEPSPFGGHEWGLLHVDRALDLTSGVTDQVDLNPETGFDHDTLSRVLPIFVANLEPSSLGESFEVTSKFHLTPPEHCFLRRYGWGEIDILDPRLADTVGLYTSFLNKAFTTVSLRPCPTLLLCL
jgi:hypothetical protein